VALAGKTVRGTLDAGDKQNLILAVERVSREVVAQAQQCGDKSIRIPVARELLKDSELSTLIVVERETFEIAKQKGNKPLFNFNISLIERGLHPLLDSHQPGKLRAE
jgi:hypothetical protein